MSGEVRKVGATTAPALLHPTEAIRAAQEAEVARELATPNWWRPLRWLGRLYSRTLGLGSTDPDDPGTL